ncbi:Protein Skeletor, isoforms B/C [Habropoda laboriosa]|uniref:Protein Skeletor, isoforms B/C n=1 Tax=Habropoda laboriosa TaxID=597456 RepID=A0A0L7RBN6_9HYME|nr:Protein Skeletor, isoforms B/C [Habropoda laboriosa]
MVFSTGHANRGHANYGKPIGNLTKYAHKINGEAYVVDDTTIFIKGFSYDGTGPDAYFWVGNSTKPDPQGYIVPYPEIEKGRDPVVLKMYNDTDIILKLPDGMRIRDINWLSVWCRRFTVNFADVYLPANLKVPKVRVLPEFSRLAHGLRSGNITILDSKTFYIPNLHYDGAGPDAYFWIGNGTEPNTFGIKVPNERKSLLPLRGYQGEDIEIVLPGNYTVYDIDWLSVWCVQHHQNFGHVLIPKDLDVPPALGQTKITYSYTSNSKLTFSHCEISSFINEVMYFYRTSSTPTPPQSKQELTNCKELLEGRVQVQWEMIGEEIHIRVSARIREDQYVAFGLSGYDGKSEMIGGDVVVVGYNNVTGEFIAKDYYISDYAQCDGMRVTYRRPLRTNEPVKDRMIPDKETSVIAAIGPLNSRGEANAHHSFDKTIEDIRIDFTSRHVHECPNSLYNLPNMSNIKPWPPAVITNKTSFSARIGPAGGKRGYSSITGDPAWGVAWYINDLLIPEITVERGQTYTFIVEGGNDPTNPARRGGFSQNTEAAQMAQRVYAGVKYDADGYPYPTAAGRYCEWVHKTVDMSADMETFENFFETLRLECDKGEPAKLVWTVSEDTPDMVYYQCYTHRNLGWKIHVVNSAHAVMPLLSLIATSFVVGMLQFIR